MIIVRLWWIGFAVSRETWKPTWQDATIPATTKSRAGPKPSEGSQTTPTLRRRGRALVTEPTNQVSFLPTEPTDTSKEVQASKPE